MGDLINLLSSVHILCCAHQQSAAKVAAVSTVTFLQSSVIAACVVSLKVVETACSEMILDVNSWPSPTVLAFSNMSLCLY